MTTVHLFATLLICYFNTGNFHNQENLEWALMFFDFAMVSYITYTEARENEQKLIEL